MSINENLTPKETSYESSTNANLLMGAPQPSPSLASMHPTTTTSMTSLTPSSDPSMLPSWSYATKKTVAKGALNVSLLLSNATSLKFYYQLDDKHRTDLWSANVALLISSLILQTLVAIMIGLLASLTPKTKKHHNHVNLLNNACVILVIVISIINVIISSIGLKSLDNVADHK